MCAFLYMSSQISAEKKVDRDVLRDFATTTEMCDVLYVVGSETPVSKESSPNNANQGDAL